MNEEILTLIKPLFGHKCFKIKVGWLKSLRLDFGKKIPHTNPRLKGKYYGEWRIGTYYCSWRILSGGKIICASNDGSEKELDEEVQKIEIGSITEISQLSDFDVRVTFDNGIEIDFLATISDDDVEAFFHMLCPEHYYVELLSGGKWITGKSNEPYTR